jgi:hypothetical protein
MLIVAENDDFNKAGTNLMQLILITGPAARPERPLARRRFVCHIACFAVAPGDGQEQESRGNLAGNRPSGG